MLLPLLGAFVTSLGALGTPVAPVAGVSADAAVPKPHDSLRAPSFQQQTTDWTVAQIAAYQGKLREAGDFAKARSSGGLQPDYCVPQCVPNSHYAFMTDVWEGSADCACGPATATEMYSTYTHYYGQPNPGLSLSQVESEIYRNGWYSCGGGTYRSGLQAEMNNHHQSQDVYVWQDISSGTDVYDYTAVDLGGYNFPVGFDGETYGPNGYPLDNYQGVNWTHYLPAYGYDGHSNVYVADPHYGQNHQYSSQAVYLFIDNFPYYDQILW